MHSSPMRLSLPSRCPGLPRGRGVNSMSGKLASPGEVSGFQGTRAMKVAPRLLLAMLATLPVGCRTAGTDSIAHTRPPEIRPQPAFDIDQFVAQHNENAARIQSLEARPSIGVKIGPNGEGGNGGADGRLALERPRSFKLELSHGLRSTNIADIGSNDEKFWFWFANKKDKSVYFCNYDDLSSTSLAVTYQPDWIVEAMGLKPITSREAAQIKVHPGTQPGTSELLFPPTRSGGQTYSRVMIVSDRTLRVQEFRIKDADGKTAIALATIKKYQSLPAGAGLLREWRSIRQPREPACCRRTWCWNGKKSSSPWTCCSRK